MTMIRRLFVLWPASSLASPFSADSSGGRLSGFVGGDRDRHRHASETHGPKDWPTRCAMCW